MVEGNIPKTLATSKAPFFIHNQQLVKEIEDLEAKSRRKDILVDDQQLFQFYDERIGHDIITLKHFETWRKGAERKQSRLLYIDKEYLMQHGAAHINELQFPARLSVGDLVFALSYRFEPNHSCLLYTSPSPRD